MKAVEAAPGFEFPREHDFGPAAVLALAVHVVLVAVLMLGVHWQSRAPDVVTVELWRPPPAPRAEAQPVEPPPKPAPPPEKPEPRIEKPDIAVKEAPKPKPKPKPEPRPEPKPKPGPVAKPAPKPEPMPDETLAQQLLAEALQREQTTLEAERERQRIKDQLQREQQAARDRAMQTWIDKVRNSIRQHIVMPPDVQGNPQAEVLVTLLPNYEVLDAKLVISSGHAAYDDAVLRAIIKASPLPKPDTRVRFERALQLKFRPKD